jgi:AAA15 family ATPase/GTPase
MVANTAKEHLETHTFDSGIPELGQLLRSAAVYGPNAAGKTNLMRALQFMQGMVINSASLSQTPQSRYDPFKFASTTRAAPSRFEVAFIQNNTRYEYGFSSGPERVDQEWLIEYPMGRGRKIFDRAYNDKTNLYAWSFSSHFKGNRAIWRDSTRPNALFLSTAIQLNSTYLLPVFEWFQKRLVVIAGGTTLNPFLTLKLLEQPDGKRRLLPFLHEADFGIADLEIQREPIPAGAVIVSPNSIIEQSGEGKSANLVRVSFSHWSKDVEGGVALDFSEESTGTQVLFRSAGAWLNVFANGEILLVDEIDTSLHPLLTRFLIERFHSNVTNPNNAQLIFSTHNTSLLAPELFRRDQIWFVEKERIGESKLFPLIEFSPRNNEHIERWYLRGKYGALPILSELPS